MKISNKTILLFSLAFILFASCKKNEDEEGELDIHFKTDSGFIYSDSTIASGTAIEIGVEAETNKVEDPIIKFNISESVNNGTASTVYSEDLQNQQFEYDYGFNLSDSVANNTHTYTFTITNKDGINAQQSLTITVQ